MHCDVDENCQEVSAVWVVCVPDVTCLGSPVALEFAGTRACRKDPVVSGRQEA